MPCACLLLLLLGCSPGDAPTASADDPRTAVFSLIGNGVGIASGNSLPSREDHTDFGAVPEGTEPPVHSFTVRNDGEQTLTLGTVRLPSGFSLFAPPSTTVEPGETTVFAVQMDTRAIGTPSGEISLSSNDTRQNPFVFAIRGEVTQRIVEIAVLGNGIEITPETEIGRSNHTDFGVTPTGRQSTPHVFTIRNLGNVLLTLDAVIVPSGFEVAFPPNRTIAPGEDTILYVRMSADSAGIYAGEIRIEIQEAASASFSFPVHGVAAEPMPIAVLGNGHRIPNGSVNLNTLDHTFFIYEGNTSTTVEVTREGNDRYRFLILAGNSRGDIRTSIDNTINVIPQTFGNIATVPGDVVTRTFTILNEGDRPVTLNRIDVPAGFMLLTESVPILVPGASADIQVQLDSTNLGFQHGVLQIASDEITALPFTFAILGFVSPTSGSGFGFGFSPPIASPPPPTPEEEALPPAPRINVFGDGRSIFNRSTIPSPEDFTDFGAAFPGEAPVVRTFTIRNTGELPLTLTPVSVPEGFTLLSQPASPIEPGETASFQVQLDSSILGIKSGLISFQHNAINLDPFTFTIRGVVREPSPFMVLSESEAEQAGEPPQSGQDSVDFGTVPLNGMPILRTFTVHNGGELPLTIGSIGVPEGFTLVSEPADTLSPGTTTRFQVRLESEAVGNKAGILRIPSNDPLQNPAVLSLQGIVTEAKPIFTLAAGSHIHFDSQILRQEPARTVALNIRNDGTLPLEIGAVGVPNGFAIESLPVDILAPGATTQLRIRIDNTFEGERSGVVSIQTNDTDHNPFTVGISGNVLAPQAVSPIVVLGNLRGISNLSTTPLEENHTDFGAHARNANATAATRTFTIRNDGDAPFTLGEVNVPAGFILVGEPDSTVQRRSTTSFEIRLDTSQPGTHEGAVFFTHDGASVNPFAFQIRGTVGP